MHKHSFVQKITAFSLVIAALFLSGILPETAVHAASISDLKAQAAVLEAAEEENLARWDSLQVQISQLERHKAEQNENISKAPEWSLVLFLDYADTLQQLEIAESAAAEVRAALDRIAAEKANLAEALDVWYAEYRDALEAASLNAGGTGFANPVWPMPGYTTITCMYLEDGHRGVDISGHSIYGEPIVAAAAGRVTWSGWMDSYGYCVFLDHGGGISTRYAHASALACEVGDRVSSGETIAYVGSTGNSTGPHLHFEVLRSGALQDPLRYYE